ncbi:MAG: FMN-binding protein [Faecalibacterium sp.]
MKNKMTRNVILMAVVTVIMAVALSLYIQNTGTVPAADNAASLTDGIYTSSAQGCLSDVTVKVTVTGGRVTGVEIDASGETPELGGAAAEALAAALLKTGSTAGVDAVSGSTMTSQAIFTAMDDCLRQAQ